MSGEHIKFGKTPPPVRREPPPVPEINPKVKELMEQPLTVADCQYILSNIKGRLEKKYKEVVAKASEEKLPNVVVDPALQEIEQDILKCAEIITRGYTAEYTPPNQPASPQGTEGGSIMDRVDDLLGLFDEIDPELKGKMGKTLGKLFDMLNEKLGIG